MSAKKKTLALKRETLCQLDQGKMGKAEGGITPAIVASSEICAAAIAFGVEQTAHGHCADIVEHSIHLSEAFSHWVSEHLPAPGNAKRTQGGGNSCDYCSHMG